MREIDPNLPVDKIAALVVSKSTHQGFDFKCGDKITSMSPLPIRQFPGLKQHDLTGVKTGRFTVIGCSTFKPKNHRTSKTNTVRWVVKCSCGRYQMFTPKAVKKNIGNPDFACVECERVIFNSRRNQLVSDLMIQKFIQ